MRIRWSQQLGEWHIEQKVSRGLFPGTKPSKKGWDETVDPYVRSRDGYVFIMSVRTGDRMPCPRCNHEVKVPYMETSSITCDYCRLRGHRPHISTVYFPLGDALIGHLKKIDPENPLSEQLSADLDRANDALAAERENKVLRETDAGFHERYNRVVGIPQFGYSGKTNMWIGKEAA